jgi:hypothetical protein
MAKRTVRALTIWMNAEFVGTWRIKSGVDELQYAGEWVAIKPQNVMVKFFELFLTFRFIAGLK